MNSPIEKNIAPKTVQRSLMIPLAVVFLLLIVFFFLISVTSQNSRLNQSSRQTAENASHKLNELLSEQSAALSAIGQALITNARLRNGLKMQDRRQLLRDSTPIFSSLKAEYNITHFYFHRPDRVNLLRIHKPEKNGDLINRFTVLKAERTGKTASGIELGSLGTFTLRMVLPVMDNNILIGYLELGKEIEDVLSSMHQDPEIEIAVCINKQLLHRTRWENGMQMLDRPSDWDQFPNYVLIYSSLSPFPNSCGYLNDNYEHFHNKVSTKTASGTKSWRILTNPLKDVSGATVGSLPPGRF
jgi:hypothetical protein